jgi:hypothetical protein
MGYIAVVKHENNRITKYQPYESKSDADAHVETYGGFVAEAPSGLLKYWVVDADNKTLTHDKASEDSAAIQHAFDMLREERNFKLVESDWVVTKALEAGTSVPDDWKTYREQLRQLPNKLTDEAVLNFSWPTKPS